MGNSYHQRFQPGTGTTGIQIMELTDDTENWLVREAGELLNEYGRYMYEELKLIAGKETFFKELDNFPGPNYRAPSGAFVVVRAANMPVGCIGIKKFGEDSCEMKRMYVRPAYRGKGIGGLLCKYVIDWCRKSMKGRILLDTNAEMKDAVSLYRKWGFIEIAPYCVNENAHPVFMEYIL